MLAHSQTSHQPYLGSRGGSFTDSGGTSPLGSVRSGKANKLGYAFDKDFSEDVYSGNERHSSSDFTATFHGEAQLPTEFGTFMIRSYRLVGNDEYRQDMPNYPVEPVVIYSLPPTPPEDDCCNDCPPPSAAAPSSQPFSSIPGPVNVRIHDQCFTSEVFGSLRCDCKEQLNLALQHIGKHGGAIIYLQQEGRGIGIANKVKAYGLQDKGLDTVDANLHLGLPEDARQYNVVPSILNDLGIGPTNDNGVMLMTNNPYKVQKLDELGVKILGTVPVVIDKTNEFNRAYIATKLERMNHMPELRQSLNMAPQRAVPKGGATASPPSPVVSPDDLDGVVASEDGYCFGRQSVLDAIAATKRGELVVVVDDMDRENEGDLILAASLATPATVSEMVKYTSGVLCVALPGEDMDRLNIPPMVAKNEDPKGTAFGVSVDATRAHGITTGISGKDRATTINLMGSGASTAADFVRPGHIFPLRARDGGVLTRDGHTEATVDLARLAGLAAAGVLCEIVSEENEGEMARLPELRRFAKEHGYVMTSIADMIAYRKEEGI